MGRFFKFIFQLIAAAIFIFLCIAAWIIFDGLTDEGQKADVGLVVGHAQGVRGTSDAQLDRVVELYSKGAFPSVIIIGTKWQEIGNAKEVTVAQYLEAHGVPPGAIIANHVGTDMQETSQEVAAIMKSHQFFSVMIITEYYDVTRVKLALTHEGVAGIEKAHVGTLRKEDALKIGRGVVALCDYVGRVYLLPEAEKAREEAKVGMDKASVDAEKAKEGVDKSLDNLAK
jgi:hypothetical protein